MNKKSDKRPWGNFRRFTLNEKSTVKILSVKPEQENSLQKHKKRSEFWSIIDGPAKVTIGKKTTRAKAGDEFFIKQGQLHRIGAYKKPVRVLEVSFGTFDESDITRVEDKYGRVKK